jgi:Zn ribbon nucleic-acid-binding protein
MDRIHVHQQGDVQFKACVACDYEEQMSLQVRPDELPTRVSHRTDDELVQQDDVAVVRILNR